MAIWPCRDPHPTPPVGAHTTPASLSPATRWRHFRGGSNPAQSTGFVAGLHPGQTSTAPPGWRRKGWRFFAWVRWRNSNWLAVTYRSSESNHKMAAPFVIPSSPTNLSAQAVKIVNGLFLHRENHRADRADDRRISG